MEERDTGRAGHEQQRRELLDLLRRTRHVPDPPDPQQVATALVEVLPEVDHLQRLQGPREFLVVARPVPDGRDPAVEPVLLEREQKLPLHPLRLYGLGRQNHYEPVAPQRRPDLVVPLLRAQDVGVAVPDWHTMVPEHLREPSRESLIGAGMGQKTSSGTGTGELRNPPAWLRIASAIGWTF